MAPSKALEAVYVVAFGSVVLAVVDSTHWLSWLLFGLTMILPLGFSMIREHWPLATTVYLVIGCQQVIAVLITFFLLRPIDLWDATYFDVLAAWAAQEPTTESGRLWEIGYLTYVNCMSGIYRINNTFFTGVEVSVLFSVLGLLLMIELAHDCKVPPTRLWWVALAGLIPGSLLFFSVTYREAWQFFFLVMAVFGAMRVVVRGEVRWWLIVLVAVVLLGLLQKALLLYAGFLLILTAVFSMFSPARLGVRLTVGLTIPVLCVALGVMFWLEPQLVTFLEPTLRLIDADLLNQISVYRERMVNWGAPRTGYKIIYDWSNGASVAITLASIYAHYLFAPFSGISRWVDLYPIAEACMRFSLLSIICIGFFRMRSGHRQGVVFLLAIYLSLTLMWSIGTTNYGQAIRHHALSNWILFVLTAVVLSSQFVGPTRFGGAKKPT